MIGQSADVVVALDDRRLPHAAFDNVGVDRALHEEIDLADLLRLFLKHADELFADDLTLAFGVFHAFESGEEPLARVDHDHMDAQLVAVEFHDLLGLVLPQQTVVDEYAGQSVPHRLVHQHRRDGRIDAARKRTEHLLARRLFAYARDKSVGKVAHAPVARAAADIVEEVFEHCARPTAYG